VAWYRDNGNKYYFDSYSIQPPDELKRYLRSPIFYNTEQIQPKQEVFCGHLCMYVLKQKTPAGNSKQFTFYFINILDAGM